MLFNFISHCPTNEQTEKIKQKYYDDVTMSARAKTEVGLEASRNQLISVTIASLSYELRY